MCRAEVEGWHTPLISARRKEKQADLCEFKDSLVYRVSSRTVRAFNKVNPVSKEKGKIFFCFLQFSLVIAKVSQYSLCLSDYHMTQQYCPASL